jgi:hypothetical protein
LDFVDDGANAFKYLVTIDTADLPSESKVFEKLSNLQFIGAVSRVAWAVLKGHHTKTNHIALSFLPQGPRYNAKC